MPVTAEKWAAVIAKYRQKLHFLDSSSLGLTRLSGLGIMSHQIPAVVLLSAQSYIINTPNEQCHHWQMYLIPSNATITNPAGTRGPRMYWTPPKKTNLNWVCGHLHYLTKRKPQLGLTPSTAHLRVRPDHGPPQLAFQVFSAGFGNNPSNIWCVIPSRLPPAHDPNQCGMACCQGDWRK